MAEKGKSKAIPENDDATKEMEEILSMPVETLRPSQRAVIQMLTDLERYATEDTDDQKAFTGDDIAAILMAEDEATMWEADELPRFNAKVLSGCKLAVFGYEVKFSNDPEIKSGLIGPGSHRKMYLLIHASRVDNSGDTVTYRLPDVGDEFTWNTSARFIVAKLYKLAKFGRFDNGGSVQFRIHGTDLGGGKSVEKIKPLDAVTVGATAEPPF